MAGLVFAIAVWGIVHSTMASLAFKEAVRRRLGLGVMKYYRLLYNMFSVASFVPVLYMAATVPSEAMYSVPTPWSWLMLAGQGVSALLLVVAVLQTDTLSFVGLRQLFEDEKPGNLVTHGLYRVVRHPLYTFGLLSLWLSPAVRTNSFVLYLSLTVYIVIGAYFEERKLVRDFGQAYTDYRSSTPMLIPGLKFNGNK